MERVTTEGFIKKATLVHGDRYCYSKVEYKRNSIKVCITCQKHGDFWQTPMTHVKGIGCPICGVEAREKKRYSKLREWAVGTEYENRRDVIIMPNKKIAFISEEDYDMLSSFCWHACPSISGGYYARAHTENGQIFMHRLILGVDDPDIEVDHKDGVKFNNRRENLRTCNHTQNIVNISSKNKNGYRGVCKNFNKYQANLRAYNEIYYLGTFDTPIEAAKAYDAKAREIHGEFAILNFP